MVIPVQMVGKGRTKYRTAMRYFATEPEQATNNCHFGPAGYKDTKVVRWRTCAI